MFCLAEVSVMYSVVESVVQYTLKKTVLGLFTISGYHVYDVFLILSYTGVVYGEDRDIFQLV
jgi:hypothetical protein